MEIEIQVFGRLQRYFGVASFFMPVSFDLNQKNNLNSFHLNQTIQDLLDYLAGQQPEAAETLARSVCAVGTNLLPRQARLADLPAGEIVVILPAVSGG